MCGIAGAVNFKLDERALQLVMAHRGPDDQNSFTQDNISFYHLRLSILDIEGGKQPMTLHERFTIIYNGEIFNYKELIQQFDLKLTTHSDTEVLLLLYEKFQEDCLKYLDGMFAFAIYDAHKKNLFIARDRAGKKPLYLYKDARKIVFASELNGLKSQLPLEIEEKNFFQYMRLGVFYRQFTPYKDVSELRAGTYVNIDCSTLEISETRWWNVNDYYQKKCSDSFAESLEKTEDYLRRAVKNRIESSDLEVGCFLSGGIDSSLITAIASGYTNNLKTLTVSIEGEYDEAPFAKLVADRFQTNHKEISISFANLKNDVEQILSSYGEPFFDSSCIPSYYLSKAAKEHVTVVLNGDGADELFGGYRRYVPFSKYDFFAKGKLLTGFAKSLQKIMPPSHDKKSNYFFITRLISFATKSNLEIYLSAGLDLIEDYEHHILAGNVDYLQPMRNDFKSITGSPISGLQKIMNLDFDTNLFSDLLVKMDIATMAHSLEGRSPFLSKSLMEYAPGLPDNFKVNGGKSKFLLRQLSKKYLPASLINQPKRGFEIPLKEWINGELKEMVHGYINASDALNKRLLSPSFTQTVLENRGRIPAEKRAKILWMLFCMEVWYKKVYLSQ
jgi:asparagine synthase (glutamine-hydrolysing)